MGHWLTPAESRAAVQRYAEGESCKSIAATLGVSKDTISNHVRAHGGRLRRGAPGKDDIRFKGRWVHDGHLIQRGVG